MRTIVAAAEAEDQRALLALRMFTRRAASWMAAVATALPRLDAVVFTGGIGEHAAGVRADICERLGVLGVPSIGPIETDEDTVLTSAGTRPAVLRIEAREDLVIASEVWGLVGTGQA